MRHVDIVAEIGINHNGSIETALEMIRVAKDAGCDYVKFQKRDPDLCVPIAQRDVMRDTPWGRMSYIDYKHKIEFGRDEYDKIDALCKDIGIGWFVSVWDEASLAFAESYNPDIIKIPSALNESYALIEKTFGIGKKLIISTGMAGEQAINKLTDVLVDDDRDIIFMHSVSSYPLEDENAELSTIIELEGIGFAEVGYSDHTRGIHMAVAAVGMGATMIEKHITLDRTMWGTDQSASLEPQGLKTMVRNIRAVCNGWGLGFLQVRDCEKEAIRRLKG